MENELSHIRNFCIIAHIDHGKSTLADRMLLLTHTIEQRDFRDQVLDSMDLERERGITIKCHPVTMRYKAADGRNFDFNLIDTPGHVDFTYEVSRSMASCEGALLVVDAAQGVEAQTVANAYLAIENNLEIIPVLNKVDLPTAKVDEVCRQIEDILGIPTNNALHISAKTGQGVPELLEAIITRVPPPTTDPSGQATRALVFDSIYDAYRGVVAYVRVVDGRLKVGDRVKMIGTGLTTEVKEVGIFAPQFTPVGELKTGQVGYMISTIKEPREMRIGDTLTATDRPSTTPLPGFKTIQPMVFSGIYPVNTADYEKLKASLGKLALNDSAFTHQAESSVALGFGFRCGFLGLLHLEIVQERLRREFDVDIISTYPAVVYKVFLNNGEQMKIDNPIYLPDTTKVDHIEEPMIKACIICHNEHIGDVMKLIRDRRGEVEKMDSLDVRRVMLYCLMPLNEILVDFYDFLKSVSHGYASMDYEFTAYAVSDLVKLDILLNGEVVDAFSCLIHRSKAEYRGRQMCKALKEVIPAHLFAVPIQAAVGGKIIARETIKALRKDVTAKCYGGDISRKRKLLERQKEGKKRMKLVGSVNVPQEAFVTVLRSTD
ncbi:MAG: elongation factor 4 [Lentisphaerae bacterium]|nr:elongation factor 4 [Lentisphaerota bacterium]